MSRRPMTRAITCIPTMQGTRQWRSRSTCACWRAAAERQADFLGSRGMQFELQGRRIYAYTGTKSIVPSQRTLLFIHGAANDHSVWALQSRYFAYHGFNVLAVDLPGHGRSAGEALPSVEAIGDW